MDLEVVAGRQLSIALSMIVLFSKYPWISLNISSYNNSEVFGPGLSLAHAWAAPGWLLLQEQVGVGDVWSLPCSRFVPCLLQHSRTSKPHYSKP